jgi:hypothetical protein
MSINPSPSSDKRVEENNTELLQEYLRLLNAGSPQEFHRAVDPMTTWLSDSRAYYPLARRQVMIFLHQAELGLCKILAGKSQPDVPLGELMRVAHSSFRVTIEEYMRLLNVLMKFRNYFVEPDQRG